MGQLAGKVRCRLVRIHRRSIHRQLGQPEVQELRLPAVRDEDVRGLDVPVDDPLAVGGLQRIRHLRSQLQQPLHLQRLAADPVLQGLAFHQLHHEEGVPLVLSDLVDHADVGMVEGRSGPCLTLETLEGVSAAGELLGQELHRHVAVEAHVLGFVYHTHPAPAEPPENSVMGQRLADHRGLGPFQS
jgi:hypothetical protein